MEGEKNLTQPCNHIHFIGIGGTGMSGIAKILLNLGYEISGSDLRTSTALNRLKSTGARVFIGHKATNVVGADLVVISSAIPESNPEYIEAIESKIPVVHRADMLSLLMEPKKGIAITGAHGKTTTTSMISLILEKNGYDPTVIIGGELNDIGGNATLGNGDFLVAEADESDGSFLKLTPYVAVVTNIENDHMDYYKNMNSMKSAFKNFLNNLKNEGFAVLGTDNENVREIAENLRRKHYTYGINNTADYMPKNIFTNGMFTSFDIFFRDKFLGKVELRVPGLHNIYNATAAIVVGSELGISFEGIADAIKAFKGVQRRFQLIGNINGIKIIDDYAHHPTEIKATLNAAKSCNPRRLIAIFQPHRFTRTMLLANEFGAAFEDADEVIVTKIFSAGEQSIEGVSSMLIVNMLKQNGKKVTYIDEKNEIPDILSKRLKSGDYVMTIGAGDVCKVAYDLTDRLKNLFG